MVLTGITHIHTTNTQSHFGSRYILYDPQNMRSIVTHQKPVGSGADTSAFDPTGFFNENPGFAWVFSFFYTLCFR